MLLYVRFSFWSKMFVTDVLQCQSRTHRKAIVFQTEFPLQIVPILLDRSSLFLSTKDDY